jgi:hypothetical protein
MIRSILVVLAFLSGTAHAYVCYICGSKSLGVQKPSQVLTFPGQPQYTCETLSNLGLLGVLPEANCAALPKVIGMCECGPVTVPLPP